MFFEFCHHCGNGVNQVQEIGKPVVCAHCKQVIGTPQAAPEKVMIDKREELIRQGVAARCNACQQVVEIKGGTNKTYVPHFQQGEKRRMCPNSGKPVPV